LRAYYHSPIGTIEIIGNKAAVCGLKFSDKRPLSFPSPEPRLKEAIRQIDEYFRGKRRAFTLCLDLQGTEFQISVWRRVADIPFGRTASYGEIAAAVGRPGAARAVGAANAINPVAIIIPCHRVIGSGGELVGYGGGLWRKKWLLSHERRRPTG